MADFFKDVGKTIGGFTKKEAKNVGDYGVMGPFLGGKGAQSAWGIAGSATGSAGQVLQGAGGLLGGIGKGASSPWMWIGLAAISGVVIIIMVEK